MASTTLRAVLLIVSTTAAKDPSTDASQAVLSDVLEEEGGGHWELVDTKIVPDVATQIQRQIMLWTDVAADTINLILTTGGTGFAVADNTPEVYTTISKIKASVDAMIQLTELRLSQLYSISLHLA